jgi:hypothetical protein
VIDYHNAQWKPENKYISLVPVQFLNNSAVTETIRCEPWGLTKECEQVDGTGRHSHLLLHIEHHAATRVITVLHILVTYNTCLLLHHLLSPASFSRSTLKYYTCIKQII